MINRNVLKIIAKSIQARPVTLITGARQVGKTTLASHYINKGFNYVTLDSSRDLELAQKDPDLFLQIHKWPLIIDEVQRAPQLLNVIEEIVNKEKMKNTQNYGMFILTSSQMYRLMNNVTESLAGRVSIIHVLPLSRNEILDREEQVFSLNNLIEIQKRANLNPLSSPSLFKLIVKGMYPEIYSNNIESNKFYADYVESYLERDVRDIINVKNIFTFRRFMELIASQTGEELVYDNLAKALEVDMKTIKSWLSVLIAGDIVYLLEPYNEYSITKRIVKRPKIYFNDTGLACYLARLNNSEILMNSIFAGRFVETFIINEIRKTFLNNGIEPGFYYYRDNNQNEIDLIILNEGIITRIECKTGIRYNLSDVKGFKVLDNTNYKLGPSAIICNTDSIYPLEKDKYILPLAGI